MPAGVEWNDHRGEYMPIYLSSEYHLDIAVEHDARLDTFTRCQETMAASSEIIFHANNLLKYVRDKYGVIGDDFSCEHMRGIAAAIKRIKE